jgi:hypothetical protein
MPATPLNQADGNRQPTSKKGNSMKANQLATLVLRLMGIYCLIQSIPLIGMSGAVVANLGRDTFGFAPVAVVAQLLPALGLLTTGILLILFAVSWGDRLVQPTTAAPDFSAVSFEQIQALAFAVAGVIIFTGALPQLANGIFDMATWAMFKGENQVLQTYRRREFIMEIGVIVKAAIGLYLFFNARGFANFWRSLRTFGTPKPPPGN